MQHSNELIDMGHLYPSQSQIAPYYTVRSSICDQGIIVGKQQTTLQRDVIFGKFSIFRVCLKYVIPPVAHLPPSPAKDAGVRGRQVCNREGNNA